MAGPAGLRALCLGAPGTTSDPVHPSSRLEGESCRRWQRLLAGGRPWLSSLVPGIRGAITSVWDVRTRGDTGPPRRCHFTPCPASVCCTALGLTKETVTESEAVKVNGLAISGTEPVTGAEQWLARQKSLDSSRQVCRGNMRGAEVTASGGCEGATAPWQGLGLLLLRNLLELLGTSHQANKMCPSPTTERQVIRRNGISAINAINYTAKSSFAVESCHIPKLPEALAVRTRPFASRGCQVHVFLVKTGRNLNTLTCGRHGSVERPKAGRVQGLRPLLHPEHVFLKCRDRARSPL